MTTISRTILGVGSNPGRIAAGRATLKRHGFEVVTATSVAAALAVCAAMHVDAVVVGKSVPSDSAQTLMSRLRYQGGPPVVYLSADKAGAAYAEAGLQRLSDKQFVRMLRTILVGNCPLDDMSDSRAHIAGVQRLRAWWLALLLALASTAAMAVFDTHLKLAGGTVLLAALAVSVVCAAGCVRSQLHLIPELRDHGLHQENWYPGIALGLVFLLPGVLVETAWFLIAAQKEARHEPARV